MILAVGLNAKPNTSLRDRARSKAQEQLQVQGHVPKYMTDSWKQ